MSEKKPGELTLVNTSEELEELAEVKDVAPSEVNAPSLSNESERLRAKRDFVFNGRTMTDIAKEFGCSITSVRYWRDKENWELLKKEADNMRVDFQNALALTRDPSVKIEDLKENTVRKVMNVLLLSSTKLEHLLAKSDDGLAVLPLAGEVQKLVTALEKFVTAEAKHKNGGVEPGKRDSVVHYHLDVNEAMRVVQESRKKGVKLTVEEAMNILSASQGNPAKKG